MLGSGCGEAMLVIHSKCAMFDVQNEREVVKEEMKEKKKKGGAKGV